MIFDPLQDNKSELELISSMGDDLTVVNDARTSYDKRSKTLTEKDIKLIRYLIKYNHSSPLRGVVFKFRVKAPLYVTRQWFKHLIASNHNDEQLGWNEKSLRYTEIKDVNEFYIPLRFRKQSAINKQSSDECLEYENNREALILFANLCQESYRTYEKLIKLGVGREQARGVLVPSVYTSWVWTVSLQAVLNFLDLRQGDSAQYEIRCYAERIHDIVKQIVPETMKAWNINK
jgi:thymidylate synthase (FAD)